MKKILLGMFTAIALVTVGCGDNGNDNKPDAGTDSGTPDSGINCEELAFKQPDGTVALNFTIDASARAGEFTSEDMEWKGTFTYDKESRLLTYAADWAGGAGPYAPVYDDGPWTCGGHEPEGAVAGDDIFGITAFFPIPTEDVTFNYGAQVAPGPKCSDQGGCWIWVGANGEFVVPANSSTPIDVDGLTLAPKGDIDMRLTIDTTNLPDGVPTEAPVKIKGSYCSWNPEEVTTEASGVYTYTLSESSNCELLAPGTPVQFVWVIGSGNYEYKQLQGLTAAIKGPSDADWVEQTLSLQGTDQNPAFTVPE